MITATDTISGVEVDLTLHAEGVSLADMQRIIDGVAREDMLPVSAADILGSYATYGAFIRAETGERRMVGFARQLHRDFMKISDQEELCVSELGTVWIDPAYRGRNIGPFLIRTATSLMRTVGFVPVAVCNERSRAKFEAEGYTPVGILPRENGHDRVVEMYENHTNWFIEERWQTGLRADALAFMQSLPRFQQMHIT